jgi:putative membrane protein
MNMKKKRLLIVLAPPLLLCCSLISACGGRDRPVHAIVNTETEVLSEMHSFDQIAIRAGDLARSRGTTADIRNFGTLLVRDQSDADRRVQGLAKEWSIHLIDPIKKTPEEEHSIQTLKQDLATLRLLSGPKFDAAFIELTANAHHLFLDMLKQGSQQLGPSPIKVLIVKLLPILKQHEFLCAWCRGHCLNHGTY